MARKSNPQPLTLTDPAPANPERTPGRDHLHLLEHQRSPLSPKSPKSPTSPFRFSSKRGQTDGDQQPMRPADQQLPRTAPQSPQTTVSLPSLQQASGASGRYERQEERERPARSGFFSNYKASKSSSRLQNTDPARQVAEDSMSRDTSRPSQVSSQKPPSRNESSTERSSTITRKPVGGPSKSEPTLESTPDSPPSSNPNVIRKNKPKPFSLLSRSRSIRDDHSPREESPTEKMPETTERTHAYSHSTKTAPLRSENDRSFRDMMSSGVRQHSEDRHDRHHSRRDGSRGKEPKENSRLQPSQVRDAREGNRSQTFSSSFRDTAGSTFLNNLRSSATKGAGAISKGLFGNRPRVESTSEREPVIDDEHYELKTINLPLVEQTRRTRISKRLEDSRDKTEFWMPAFPWRAIDYLNYKGSDVEGLYRVPGSGPQIKKWQRRFDEELDIDLFEQEDLYDINIIGSMLKAWLRELPDELFPKASQDRVSRECPGSETVPQLLIDELSNLSPFKYYLLFAITCHLSLLLAHSDKNKMDFRNLCICFQPCMKIDAYCFKFLVCDWRDCWKGCKTETQHIDQEYALLDAGSPASAEGQSSTAVESHEERNVSSSDSSKPSSVSVDKEGKWTGGGGGGQLKSLSQTQNQSQRSISTVSTNLTVVQERTPPRRTNEMRPLSPIKPLSPIGL